MYFCAKIIIIMGIVISINNSFRLFIVYVRI
ncbi:MAG: hypothetical protein JG776_561 [Caloramator sp.]|jgi:hypothetical protein|nr:hypothetical protein [Caloramator sp.]